MKLIIETALLQALVRAIKPFVAKNIGSNLPATVRLHAGEQHLTLTAGSNASAVKVQREADVELRGSTVVPAELLINLAEALPGERTLLDKDQQMLRVHSGTVHTRLTVMQEEWEPEFIHDLPGFINSAALKDAIASVQHATAKTFEAGVSRGVRLEFRDDGARVVATDGFRLALANVEDAGAFNAEVVTSREQALALAKVFTDDETLKVAADDAYLYLEGHQAMVKLSLMEGDYPAYRSIIPAQDQLPKKVRVDATALRTAVERAMILTNFDQNNRMDVVVADGRVVVVGENTYGTLKESVNATVSLTSGNEPFAFAMNTRFFREALAQVKETVLIGVPDAGPILIAPADSDAFLAVVAPLKTQDISVDEALADAHAEAAAMATAVTAPGVTTQA